MRGEHVVFRILLRATLRGEELTASDLAMRYRAFTGRAITTAAVTARARDARNVFGWPVSCERRGRTWVYLVRREGASA